MDDAMRERANTALMREMVNIFRNLMSDDHEELDSSLTDLLVTFATSEADRRERECIEYAAIQWCTWCAAQAVPATRHENPSQARWFHDMEEHGLKECEADDIREWSYQREQGGDAGEGF